MKNTLVIVAVTILLVALLWPWLQKSGLGSLPGDFMIERGALRLHFPITTGIIVSLVVSLVVWLLRK